MKRSFTLIEMILSLCLAAAIATVFGVLLSIAVKIERRAEKETLGSYQNGDYFFSYFEKNLRNFVRLKEKKFKGEKNTITFVCRKKIMDKSGLKTTTLSENRYRVLKGELVEEQKIGTEIYSKNKNFHKKSLLQNIEKIFFSYGVIDIKESSVKWLDEYESLGPPDFVKTEIKIDGKKYERTFYTYSE